MSWVLAEFAQDQAHEEGVIDKKIIEILEMRRFCRVTLPMDQAPAVVLPLNFVTGLIDSEEGGKRAEVIIRSVALKEEKEGVNER